MSDANIQKEQDWIGTLTTHNVDALVSRMERVLQERAFTLVITRESEQPGLILRPDVYLHQQLEPSWMVMEKALVYVSGAGTLLLGTTGKKQNWRVSRPDEQDECRKTYIFFRGSQLFVEGYGADGFHTMWMFVPE